MRTIVDIQKEYFGKIDHLDLELLIVHAIGKPREFVLTYPEYEIPEFKIKNLKFKIARRALGEPIAYITGHKEFFGLDLKVTEATLIPRPETEMLVEEALEIIKTQEQENIKTRNQKNNTTTKQYSNLIVDVGTGSGNIIISIASQLKNRESKFKNCEFFGIDISENALGVAEQNAKTHDVDNPPAGGITFLHGNLLDPLEKNLKTKKLMKLMPNKLLIVANLPYLSEEVFENSPVDVKGFEPKSALWSDNNGLAHYEELLKQITTISKSYKLKAISCILEFSPEQKIHLDDLIRKVFPEAQTEFKKDLAGKWRTVSIKI